MAAALPIDANNNNNNNHLEEEEVVVMLSRCGETFRGGQWTIFTFSLGYRRIAPVELGCAHQPSRATQRSRKTKATINWRRIRV